MKRTLAVEPLETRHAPAVTIVNPTTATYADVDGDRVTVRVSAGTLTAGTFTTTAAGAGEQLQKIDLTAPGFDRANLTITARRGPAGDGRVNVGHIDATGRDLGAVSIAGDLGQIDAGDGLPLAPAVRALTVHSLGRYGTDTQAAGGNLQSNIFGRLGALVVRGDLVEALVEANNAADGTIGSVTIGGSLVGGPGPFSGHVTSSGDIGPVRVGRDIQGGSGVAAGTIASGGRLAGLTVGGSILGGAGLDSGQAGTNGDLGPVRVRHDVLAGTGVGSGRIESTGRLASAIVGGSLVGGSGADSGTIFSLQDQGPVRIGRDVLGGAGANTGRVESLANLAGVTIGGTLVGGADTGTGAIRSGGHLGPVRVGGDVLGGVGFASGRISAGGRLAGVVIGGALVGGFNTDTGSVQSGSGLGPVAVRGDVQGGSGLFSGRIESGAKLLGVTVGGSLLGGPAAGSGAVRSLGDLGPVRVGGDVRGGAGSSSGRVDSLLGRVAAVTVGGSLLGGSNTDAGTIASGGDLGPVSIGHDIFGGSIRGTDSDLEGSASIVSLGRIARVFVGGSIVSGADTSIGGELRENATVRAGHDLGALVVGGSLVGNVTPFGESPVVIAARGQAAPGRTTDLAIGRVAVGGRVERTYIAAGYDAALGPVNADAQIGLVTVGGDWAASGLLAGVTVGPDMMFGTSDDVRILGPGTTDRPGVVSRIAAVVIRGQALGTPGSVSAADHYGIVAQHVVALTVGGRAFPLTPGAANDLAGLAVGVSGDLRVREVGL